MNFTGRDDMIRRVQAALGLTPDGDDGPRTWKAIVNAVAPHPSAQTSQPVVGAAVGSSLAQELVELAKKEVGVEEVDGTNCGPRVNEYKAATWLDPKQSWPWCAAFICWLMREGMKDGKYSFERPRTAGAWDFENWAKKQKAGVDLKKPHNNDIKPGDIIMFTFSHIGLAISAPKDGVVETIEGNTDGAGSREGGAVLIKKRKLSAIRSRIRITE